MNNDFTQFNFSFELVEKTKQELETSHQKLLDRISNITESEKFFINGFPVLKNIVTLNPKKQDLKKIAKALDRLSDLLEAFEEIDNKITLVNTVQNDPHWFAWAFGDFSKDVDTAIDQLLSGEN
jgi:t-SNARE complex subunit (syntaxin)